MNIIARLKILLLAVVGLLTGCIDWVEDAQDLRRFVAETKQRPAGAIEPLPEFKPYHSFVYEGASLREPFVPLVTIELAPEVEPEIVADELKPDESRKKEYLESFALDQLTMVGTIFKQDEDTTWALIRDSNAELHRVAEGNYMGLDHGEIIALNEREIVLSEIIQNGRGGWMKRSRSIAISELE